VGEALVEKIFSEYKAALREVLDTKRVERKHLRFLDDFDRDADKIEELVIKSMQPYVYGFCSAMQEFTQMKGAAAEDFVLDPKSVKELFNEPIVVLQPNRFEADMRRRQLRESSATYLKHLQITLYELIPRIQLQHAYIEYLRSEAVLLQERIAKMKETEEGKCQKKKRKKGGSQSQSPLETGMSSTIKED